MRKTTKNSFVKSLRKKAEKKLATIESDRIIEFLITEWAIQHGPQGFSAEFQSAGFGNPGGLSIKNFLRRKGYRDEQQNQILTRFPQAIWYHRKNQIRDQITANLVKRQLDWAAEIHDLHFNAATMGLSCAMKIIKNYSQRHPDSIEPGMLRQALESVRLAQTIHRTALGLPTTEGAMHIHAQMNRKNKEDKSDMEKTPVERMEDQLSYEDIKALAKARRLELEAMKEKEEIIEGEIEA